MSLIKLSFLCLFFTIIGKAQDTIVFKDKQKIIVIVKEVSLTEIQYKKLELPDGPMYIVSKNDIEKIIYKNGYIEILKTTVEPTNTGQPFVVYSNTDVNNEKITYNDTKARYYRILNLVERHPDVKRRENLMLNLKLMRNLKQHQNGTRTGAIIFGSISIAGIALYALSSGLSSGGYVDPVLALPPIVFGALGIGLGATSIAINFKLREKRKDFVLLYNE